MSVQGGPERDGRRPTIRDVAAAAGVSKSLASLVFADSTRVSDKRRALVLQAAEELGFRPNSVARSLAGDRDDIVGILVADLHNPVFAEVVDAARAELATSGRAGLVTSAVLARDHHAPRLDDHAIALFGDLRPSRLLIVGSVPEMAQVINAMPRTRVVIASAIEEGSGSAAVVRGDDAEGMRLVVEHLLMSGHKRIAHVGGEGGPTSRVRALSYAKTLRAAGREKNIQIQPADYSRASGYQAATALLEGEKPPTAITAVNDLAAVGVLAAAMEHERRTGMRIAVTGYDNTFLSALPQIDLTTVDPGNAQIGTRAAQVLLRDDEFGDHSELLIQPSLIVRGSSTSGPLTPVA